MNKMLVKIIIFTLLMGVFSYFANAMLTAVFIPYVQFENNWCLEYERTEEDGEIPLCNKFKNRLEEEKYYHQVKMFNMNDYIKYGVPIFCGFVGIFIFAYIPKLKKEDINLSELVVTGFFLGLGTPLIVVFIMTIILPAPNLWFPEVFGEIRDLRLEKVMEELRFKANGN